MNQIKIFVDAHVFDDGFQGTTTYLKGLYSEMVNDEKMQITLAAGNIEKLRNIFPDPRFKFISLKSKSKYKRLAFEIPKLIQANQFDVAHFQYITPSRKKCIYINTIHDLLFLDFPGYFPFSYRFSKKYLFKFSAKRSDLICTVSEYSKAALIKHFNIDPAKIIITPNAVEIFNGKPVDIKEKYGINRYILFVSRMEPRKNHYLMLKAFVELKLYEKDYKMIFIGRTKDVKTDNYYRYLNALPAKIRNSVVHIENISNDELNSFYKYANLFVYPSIAEGFGIPPLEAAISECKVLCSNQTAMADFNFFGNYLFDPYNIEELKTKMSDILQSDDYPYVEIKNEILKRYNWKNISVDFSKKIRSLVSQ